MRSSLRIRRRDLLGASAAAGAAAVFPFPAIAQQKSPNEKLSIAGIGAGGQGGWDIGNCASENIVALCDVDDRRCEASVQRFPKAKRYRDFRKMFDEMGKQIDAVVVGTPDHTHAPAAAMAMRLGKHCYCEKPLTHTVYEARVLGRPSPVKRSWPRRWARRSTPEAITAASWNWSRPARSARSATSTSGWERTSTGRPNRSARRQSDAPKVGLPVPKTLDWDLWLGPAPFRPYHGTYVPFQWRYWWAFGNGILGDFFCHYCDLAFWALKLRHPDDGRGRRAGPPGKHGALDDCPPGVPGPRRPAAGLAHLVSRRRTSGVGQGEEDPAVGQRRVVCRGRRDAHCRLRPAPASARREVQGLQAPGEDDSRFHRPPCGVDQGLQDRQPDHLQLRLLRRLDRGGLAVQRGPADRQEARSGMRPVSRRPIVPADRFLRQAYRPGWTL